MERRPVFHDNAVRAQLALALALAATLGTGCILDLSGLPGSGGAGATTGSSAGGAGGTSEVTTSSRMTVTSAVTATSSSTSSCTPTVSETCDDGTDNDCNGMTDCEDPECKEGFVCTPPIPSGWSPVAFNAQNRPGCPGGTAPVDIVSVPTEASTCSCTCAQESAASCTQGMVQVTSDGMSCPGGPDYAFDADNSTCHSTPFPLDPTKIKKVKVTPPPPTQGTCNGTLDSTLPPPIQGRFCRALKTGAGCADGSACVTKPDSSFASCIERDNVVPCPSGFPHSYVVGATTEDTRMCSPCACGTTATCANPEVTVYSDPACGSGAYSVPATDSCDPVKGGAGQQYKSYKYTADVVKGACHVTSKTTLSGDLTLKERQTVCCP